MMVSGQTIEDKGRGNWSIDRGWLMSENSALIKLKVNLLTSKRYL